MAEERAPWGGPRMCGELWGHLAGFFLRPEAPAIPPSAAIAVLQVFQGAAQPSPLLLGSQRPHLLGALLEGSRDELPLLSAPVGQYVHDGATVHT